MPPGSLLHYPDPAEPEPSCRSAAPGTIRGEAPLRSYRKYFRRFA